MSHPLCGLTDKLNQIFPKHAKCIPRANMHFMLFLFGNAHPTVLPFTSRCEVWRKVSGGKGWWLRTPNQREESWEEERPPPTPGRRVWRGLAHAREASAAGAAGAAATARSASPDSARPASARAACAPGRTSQMLTVFLRNSKYEKNIKCLLVRFELQMIYFYCPHLSFLFQSTGRFFSPP